MENTNKYNELKNRLPEIAEIVNKFESEELQLEVFRVLTSVVTKSDEEVGTQPIKTVISSAVRKKVIPQKLRTKKHSGVNTMIGDLNLRPKDQTSLKDFVDSKQPKDNQELIAVLIYYLKRILDIGLVNSDHIYTAFKHLEHRVPANIPVSVQVTGTRKGWVTSRSGAFDISVHGENFVEHDLPRKLKQNNQVD